MRAGISAKILKSYSSPILKPLNISPGASVVQIILQLIDFDKVQVKQLTWCQRLSQYLVMKVSRAGAVVVDDDVRAGHGRPDIIDHVAGVAARVLQVWVPAERERG